MIDSIKEVTGVDFNTIKTDEEAQAIAKEKGVEYEEIKNTRGHIINEFFETFVEETLIQPTFVMDYPVEVSPLTKRKKEAPELVERFELFIGGREYGNAYSELNDPIDQYERFVKQQEAKDKEIELIALYNLTDRRFGYNITKGGDGLHGMVISKETKKKMSLNHHNVSGTNNPAARSVVNMNNLIVYKTIRDANKSVGKNYRNSSISAVCNGKRNYAGKDENGNRISWKYLDDYLKEKNIAWMLTK